MALSVLGGVQDPTDLIPRLERWLAYCEQSLVTGRRISEPDRPMTPRGVKRRTTELAQVRAALVEARRRLEEEEAVTVTPEQTLREAGIDRKRQAEYQRKMSTLLAGREAGAATRRPPGQRGERRAARGE